MGSVRYINARNAVFHTPNDGELSSMDGSASIVGNAQRRQGIFWIATIPREHWTPALPNTCQWIKGQLERAASGYEHWQFVIAMKNKVSLTSLKKVFPTIGHYELTRSAAAEQYVWKDETSIGERFEFGKKKIKRNSKVDWQEIKENAISGELEKVPPDIYVRYYNTLTRIRADHHNPIATEKRVFVLWGPTATGKSHRAWANFPDAYTKDPRTKWWTGYRGQKHVIIDEFRGGIDVAHILRWTDKYPVSVETKGSHIPLQCTTIVFTSNLEPKFWYELDVDTLNALLRRLKIILVECKEQEVNFE